MAHDVILKGDIGQLHKKAGKAGFLMPAALIRAGHQLEPPIAIGAFNKIVFPHI